MTEDERTAVAHVRRTLEHALSPRTTSAVLFEALGAHSQSIPQALDDLTGLVRGPLAAVLRKRVGPAQAQAIVDAIEAGLDPDVDAPVAPGGPDESGQMPAGSMARRRQREDEPTRAVPTQKAPVRVAVLAAKRRFVDRLASALGTRRVDPFPVTTLRELREANPPPAVVVIDAGDFLPLDPAQIVEVLDRLPPTTARVLWGRDLPYGRSVAASFERARRSLVALSQHDGIDPLLDLIRSRRHR